jgi:threonine synthase
MIEIRCTNCKQPYPEQGAPFRCPVCTGVFDTPELPVFNPAQAGASQPGMWRYREAFGLPEGAPQISLGEGNTPLVWGEAFGRRVAFKLEYLNPTGSFKDRGSAVLVSFLLRRGVRSAVEDSSGNAGASFAAYAAHAGMNARVFVPDYAAGPKRQQIEAYGAEVVRILGPRSKTSEAVLKAAAQGEVYASHAYLPFCLAGYATIAYELFEQLGQAPGALIAPAGQGNLLLAIGRGYAGLQRLALIERLPRLVGVQALACAPLWAVQRYGAAGLGWVAEGETLAEGVRVRHPLRGDALIQLVEQSGGSFIAVEEPAILPGRDALARLGFYVEPTSAIVWSALEQLVGQLPDPIVLVLTGSGLKSLI